MSVNALGTSGLVMTPGVAVVSPHTPDNAPVEPDSAMADAAVMLCGASPRQRPAASATAWNCSAGPSQCQGHARCWEVCPEVFSLNDEGHSVVSVAEVPAELAAKVSRAVSNCPERAITTH